MVSKCIFIFSKRNNTYTTIGLGLQENSSNIKNLTKKGQSEKCAKWGCVERE